MTTISEKFEISYNFFLNNRQNLLERYKGKVIAVYLDKVLGVFQNKKEALLSVPEKYNIPEGSFVIEEMKEEEPNPVRIFQTNISFSESK